MTISRPAMETIAILSTGISSALWMNSRFNAIDRQFNELDRRLIRIESVQFIRGLHPSPNGSLTEDPIPEKMNRSVTFIPSSIQK